MRITEKELEAFAVFLQSQDRSPGTVGKYLRDAAAFVAWLDGRDPAEAAVWRDSLLERGYAPVTVNSMLSAVNRFLKFLGRGECGIRYLRVQRRAFRAQDRELSQAEYRRLLETAREQGRERLALLMEAICSTGIRVSEARYLTVEAARRGRAEVRLKGKIRTVLLPAKLCRKLLKYAGRRGTASGEIFLTRSGRGISRRQIWQEMKALCEKAGVAPSKVFPHNLRHLFAAAFYRACRDVVKLADVLGHSSINTTRLYLMTSGEEHARQLEKLGLVT